MHKYCVYTFASFCTTSRSPLAHKKFFVFFSISYNRVGVLGATCGHHIPVRVSYLFLDSHENFKHYEEVFRRVAESPKNIVIMFTTVDFGYVKQIINDDFLHFPLKEKAISRGRV
jgi:hypothetical protein